MTNGEKAMSEIDVTLVFGQSAPYKAGQDLKDKHYKPPKEFEHAKDYVVARIPKGGADGHAVEIVECRYPAAFYKIVAKPGCNSMGNAQRGFTLTTGSDGLTDRLVWVIALQISRGMLEVKE
jgi:hypothetical protein